MYAWENLGERTALVVGGTSGIGFEVAAALGAAGARVALASRRDTHGRERAAEIRGRGSDATWFGVDVEASDAVNRMVDSVLDSYGAIDILVNCAGTVIVQDFQDVSDTQWDHVMNVNLRGVFYCCRSVGRHMLARRSGSIINVASISGMIVNRPQAQSTYNISKAGVIMLTKSLAAEWASQSVRVNSISPGYIETEMSAAGLRNLEWSGVWRAMTPMGRVGQPAEVASAVVYLASDAASYVTGSNLVIDGGYTLW